MTRETFFEKFDQFADAPNVVAKMRELVLQLAVRGKLVDQLPSDEPATKLLEQIQKSKERLIKERAIRRQETDPIDCDSALFPIPQSWVWTRLGEIGDWGSGSTPPRGNHDLYDGGITWLKSGELNDNLALAGSSETVTELALKSGSFRRNQPGDVLFAMYGATVGKVAILAEPAVTNQAVCGCTPFEGVSNRYLFNYLLSQRAAFHEASEGGAQPNLSKVKIVAFPFPLPPLAEQKRIVAKVDELMALCDRLDTQQQEQETRHAALARASLARFADAPTPANLTFIFHKSYAIPPTDLRKSILTLAVQGKLVPQDPNDEPVRDQKLRVRPSDDVYEVPNVWAWTFWEDVLAPGKAAFKRGPFGSSLRKADFVASGYKVYEQYCPINDDCSFARYYITREKFEAMKSFAVQAGDFLISCSGVTLGRITQVPAVFEAGVINQALLRVRIEAAVLDSLYFKMLFRSPFFQERIFANSTGSAIPNVKGVKDLKAMPIPVPPLAEQRRIVAKVDQLMALVDALEQQLTASRATAANLLSALVAELTAVS